jgi:hypothetical protein
MLIHYLVDITAEYDFRFALDFILQFRVNIKILYGSRGLFSYSILFCVGALVAM